MKLWKTAGIAALLLVAAIASFLFFRPETESAPEAEHSAVLLSRSKYHSPANNSQHDASVWLGEYKGELYFAVPWARNSVLFGKDKDSCEGWLCKFSNGETTPVVPLIQSSADHIDVLGMQDRFIYYYSAYDGSRVSEDHSPRLLCCDVETCEITLLYSPSFRGDRNVYFSDDASVSIPLNAKTEQKRYLNVMGSEVLDSAEDSDDTKLFHAGDRSYYLQLPDNDIVEHVMVRDAGGETTELPLGAADRRSLIKTDSGLLIHNHGRRDLLYYVDEKGSVENLFSVPCSLSSSSVTVYHNTVYLSVMRWEKGASGWIGFAGYENDTVIGTYRINLEDCSIEKVSDMIFDGMYIFDDTGIFACDERNRVYKLDFDCRVIERLL